MKGLVRGCCPYFWQVLSSFSFYQLKNRSTQRGSEVWDSSRKKWLLLTPEEMVRQQLVAHLAMHCCVPKQLIATEKMVMLGEKRKRFDIGVWGTNGKIWLLAECKSPTVALGEQALDQALSYASQLPCEYLLISNGHCNYMWQLAKGGVAVLDWPKWQ